MADRAVAPPEFELYDLQADPGEIANLFDSPRVTGVQERLVAQLDHWRREIVLDPFVDPEYLSSFNEEYAGQFALMQQKKSELGGSVKGTGFRLNWDHRIPKWDAAPYEHGMRD